MRADRLVIVILDHLARANIATEAETEVTPTVSVKVAKAEKGTIAATGHGRRHDLAARKSRRGREDQRADQADGAA